MKLLSLVIVLGCVGFALSGCNTIQGAGEDIASVGRGGGVAVDVY